MARINVTIQGIQAKDVQVQVGANGVQVSIECDGAPSGEEPVVVEEETENPAPDRFAETRAQWDIVVKREHVAVLGRLWHQWVPRVTNVKPEQAAMLWAIWARQPQTMHPGVRFMRQATNRCWLHYVAAN